MQKGAKVVKKQYSIEEIREKAKEGKWEVIGIEIDRSTRYAKILCRCSCEKKTERLVRVKDILTGESKGCSCRIAEGSRKVNTIHGNSQNELGQAYSNMKSRASGKKKGRGDYKGRTVCVRWANDSTAFYADMGEMPEPGLLVERVNNKLGYWCGKPECPECGPLGREPNCKWATRIEQQRNRDVTVWLIVDGVRKTISDWAREYNITRSVLNHRVKEKREFSIEEFEKLAKAPVKELYKTYPYRGEIKTAKELAVMANISSNAMNSRLKSARERGVTYENLAEHCINSNNFKK